MAREALGASLSRPHVQEERLVPAGTVGLDREAAECPVPLPPHSPLSSPRPGSSPPRPHRSVLVSVVFCRQWLLCFPAGKPGLLQASPANEGACFSPVC